MSSGPGERPSGRDVLRVLPPAPEPEPRVAPEVRVIELQRELFEARLAEARALRASRLSALRAEHAERHRADAEALRDRLAQAEAELAEATRALAERDAEPEADEWRSELAALRRERDHAVDRLRARQRILDELRASPAYAVLRIVWRIHAALGRPLRRRRGR